MEATARSTKSLWVARPPNQPSVGVFGLWVCRAPCWFPALSPPKAHSRCSYSFGGRRNTIQVGAPRPGRQPGNGVAARAPDTAGHWAARVSVLTHFPGGQQRQVLDWKVPQSELRSWRGRAGSLERRCLLGGWEGERRAQPGRGQGSEGESLASGRALPGLGANSPGYRPRGPGGRSSRTRTWSPTS